MRRLRLALSLAALLPATPFACTSTSSTESAGSGAGAAAATGASGGPCDNGGACGDAQSGCIACAEDGHCKTALNGCNTSEDCQAYGRCLDACVQGDDECFAACADQYPTGNSAYQTLLTCVICQECPVACDGPGTGCTQ